MPSRRFSPRATGQATRKRRVVHPESQPCRRTSHALVRSPVGLRAGTRSRNNRTATRSAPLSRTSSSSSAPPPDRLPRSRQFVCLVSCSYLLHCHYLFIYFISFPPNEFYIQASSRAKKRSDGMVPLFTLLN